MLALALQLEAPPQHRPGGTWLACSRAARRCRLLLPGEVMAGLGFELAGHRLRQRPCQDREAGVLPGQHGGSGGGPVVRVAGDPGVVEDEQPAGLAAGRRRGGARRQLRGRDAASRPSG